MENVASRQKTKINKNERGLDVNDSNPATTNSRDNFFDSLKKTAFVVGTALIVFVAARNTITWHLQRFWGASGDFYQSQWEKVFQFYGGDAFKMGIYGTALVTVGVFWLCNLPLLFVDLTQRPAFLLRYKVQDNQTPDPSKVWTAVKRVALNHLWGTPVGVIAYHLMVLRGCSFGQELPTFPLVVWELCVMMLVEEFAFYYTHRLFHHPKLYRHIHKVHHEWTSPIGIVSIYAHPVEHVLSNLIPPMLGPILCGSHIATAWMWYSMALFSTTIAHCGYHFPFLPSPEAHDFHHLKFNQNYGVLGVLDRLHGTDALFRRSKAYDRHFMLLSLVPIKELIPEDPKKKKKVAD